MINILVNKTNWMWYNTDKSGELRAANNRAYYAIYHAICAIQALDKVAYKRHKEVIANFNKNYVKTEIFPRKPEYSKLSKIYGLF